MESAILKMNNRKEEGSRANNRLRKTGFVPGNIFGRGMSSVSVTVKRDDLKKGLAKHGRFGLFKLEADGGKVYDVMVKDIQLDPVSREYIHVDFQHVIFSEEVKANVPIRIEGKEALEARKLLLVHQIDFIPVKGMPLDIPNAIEINVADLQVGDNIFISDVQFPEGILPEINSEQLVISVSEAKVQKLTEEEEIEG